MAETAIPPAQNLEAEESVLGVMMLSPGAIDAVSDVLEPQGKRKFYRLESHGRIYETALNLHRAGLPVDAITLADALAKQGELDGVGGKGRIHELAALVPAASNAAHYARIVRECWAKRALLGISFKIRDLSYETSDVEDLLRQAQVLFEETQAAVTRERDTVVTMYDGAAYLDEKFRNPPDLGAGVPTPWSFLPRMHGGRLYVLGGYPADGKLLALDTPLPTPNGWTTVGDLRVGDWLIGADGKPCEVSFVTETKDNRVTYEVEFSDGEVIVACADHLWLTETVQERASRSRADRRVYNDASPFSRRQERLAPQVRTTQEIADTLYVGTDRRANHAIRNPEPLELPECDLPIDPYLLGLWLGDGDTGNASITTADPEILEAIRALGHETPHRDRYHYGIVRGGFSKQLRQAGVLGHKHVPSIYLRASQAQRLALVQGLMDTDGSVSKRGQAEFCTVLPQLASAMHELLVSLGINTTVKVGRSFLNGREYRPRHRLLFTTTMPVFRLKRKLDRLPATVPDSCGYRTITAIRPAASVPMRCLTVANESHLFLAGKSMIPTHNTVQASHFFRCAIEARVPTGFVTLEMNWQDLIERLAANMGLPAKRVQSGRFEEPQRGQAASVVAKMAMLADHGRIIDNPVCTPSDLRRYVKAYGLEFLIVDHLHMFQLDPQKQRESIEEVIRGIWQVAREFDIPVLLLAQLSRTGDKLRPFPRPTMAQIKGSGAIEQFAWRVDFVWRERDEMNMPEASGGTEYIIAKNRSGEPGMRRIRFVPAETRFEEIAREG